MCAESGNCRNHASFAPYVPHRHTTAVRFERLLYNDETPPEAAPVFTPLHEVFEELLGIILRQATAAVLGFKRDVDLELLRTHTDRPSLVGKLDRIPSTLPIARRAYLSGVSLVEYAMTNTRISVGACSRIRKPRSSQRPGNQRRESGALRSAIRLDESPSLW
jgi:hypothetical protein